MRETKPRPQHQHRGSPTQPVLHTSAALRVILPPFRSRSKGKGRATSVGCWPLIRAGANESLDTDKGRLSCSYLQSELTPRPTQAQWRAGRERGKMRPGEDNSVSWRPAWRGSLLAGEHPQDQNKTSLSHSDTLFVAVPLLSRV